MINTPRQRARDTIKDENVPLSYWIETADHSEKFQFHIMDDFGTVDDGLLTIDIQTDEHSVPVPFTSTNATLEALSFSLEYFYSTKLE